MQQNLMKKTVIGSLLFFALSMTAIVFLAAGKIVTVSNVAQDEVGTRAERVKESGEGAPEKSLRFQEGEADTGYLQVPLPEGCKADDIVIENHYMDRELWIQLPAGKEAFYEEHAISGNRERITQGFFDCKGGGCRLKFRLTGIYECRTILENENLYISFHRPGELYEKIVVIDAAGGGEDYGRKGQGLSEKDVALQIAKKLKERLDQTEIKAYYTRMDDTNPSSGARVLAANEINADLLIRIQAGESSDPSLYGTECIYNGDYFIPGFGSIELADLLEREVVTAVKGKALGLLEAKAEDEVIREAAVPAAAVSVGYLSNPREAALLGEEAYLNQIAEGVFQAVLKAFER